MIARKFFNSQKLLIPVPAAGSGYFATTGTSQKLSIYNPASNTFSLSVKAFSDPNTYDGNAAGNSVIGIYVRGDGSSSYASEKMTYASQLISAGTNMLDHTTVGSGWGMGNQTKGLFKVGAGLNTVNSYTYAGETVAVTTGVQSNITMTSNSAVGDNTFGYVPLPTGSGTVNTDKWDYSAGTRAAGTALSSNFNGSLNGGNSVGNSSVGIFISSAINNPATCAYTYGSQTTAASSSFTAGSNDNNGQGTSDGTAGLMIATATITRLWTFAGNVVSSGGSLSASQGAGAPGLSSNNPGVNV